MIKSVDHHSGSMMRVPGLAEHSLLHVGGRALFLAVAVEGAGQFFFGESIFVESEF